MSNVDYIPVDYFNTLEDGAMSSEIVFPEGKRRYDLEVSPNEVTYPDTRYSQESQAHTIVITNTGYDTLIINSITTVGPFKITTPKPTQIEAGEVASFDVSFAPIARGPVTGGVYINTGDAAGEEFVKLSGISLSGYVADLNVDLIKADNTKTGSPNYIQAISHEPIPAQDGRVLIAVDISATNTATPVQISFNNDPPLTVVKPDGSPVPVGYLVKDTLVIGYRLGNTYRLLLDSQSAAIYALIVNEGDRAEAARVAAEGWAGVSKVVADQAAGLLSSVMSLIGQSGPVELNTYDTRAAAQLANIKPTLMMITVGGRYAVGDGGAAQYLRVTTNPNSGAAFPDKLGNGWWKLVSRIVTPQMYGAMGDSNFGIDETPFFEAMIADKPEVVYLGDSRKKYRWTRNITIRDKTTWEAHGAIIKYDWTVRGFTENMLRVAKTAPFTIMKGIIFDHNSTMAPMPWINDGIDLILLDAVTCAADDCDFIRCSVYNSHINGFALSGIKSLIGNGTQASPYRHDPDVFFPIRTRFLGCRAYKCGYGMVGPASKITNPLHSPLVIARGGGAGVNFLTSSRCIVDDLISDDCSIAFTVDFAAGAVGNTFSNIIGHNTGRSGIGMSDLIAGNGWGSWIGGPQNVFNNIQFVACVNTAMVISPYAPNCSFNNIMAYNCEGSGFLIGGNNAILTNCQVIQGGLHKPQNAVDAFVVQADAKDVKLIGCRNDNPFGNIRYGLAIISDSSGEAIGCSFTGGFGKYFVTPVSMDKFIIETAENRTWIPELKFGGASTGMVTAFRAGTITRKGRDVTISFDILLSNKGTSQGPITIEGLDINSFLTVGAVVPYFEGINSATLSKGTILCNIGTGQNKIRFLVSDGAALGELTHNHVFNNLRLTGTITFFATTT